MRKIAAIGVGLAVATFGLTAMAEEPAPAPAGGGAAAAASPSSGGISAAALVGMGFKDFYKLGFGVRAGLNVAGNVYVGGTFVYHLGTTVDAGQTILGSAEYKYGIMYYGGEVGYDIAAGPATIRPYAGVGLASAHVDYCFAGNCASASSDSKLYVAPGATILFGDKIFGGADVRYVYVTGGDEYKEARALSVFGTVGMKF